MAYKKKTWVNDETITVKALNNIEEGIAGVELTPGPKGDTGAKGDPGPKGDPGAEGAKGLKGDTGAPGINGKDGDKGPKGDPGTAGKDGVGITKLELITTYDGEITGGTLTKTDGSSAAVKVIVTGTEG